MELSAEAIQAADAIDKDTIHDYLVAFVQFTATEEKQLFYTLDDKQKAALDIAGGLLSDSYLAAFGILLGIDTFVRNFHRFCGLDVSVSADANRERNALLMALLEQTSDKLLDYGDLSDLFVSVVRSMIADGSLRVCKTEFECLPTGSIVFYNGEHLFFTSPAMIAVCRRLNQSRPVVLDALAEEGLLLGKPINGGTRMTRITIHDVYGRSYRQKVFRLPRSAFDRVGEPLVLEEADVL